MSWSTPPTSTPPGGRRHRTMISLRLLDLRDVKVGNVLPALVLAPLLVGLAGAL
jgi:hypothetical protein